MSTAAPPERTQLPREILDMPEDDLRELIYLAENDAWFQASTVTSLTDEEETKVERVEKDYGAKVAKEARARLYDRHHWRSLRSFLFGTYVDLPVTTDPHRAYDPHDNPWVKVHIPGWAFTKDEHDEENPYKRLPDKRYLRVLSYLWVHERRLLIPKSRQVMVTWLFCCIAAHETLFREARRSAFVSKMFDDADALIDRVEIVKKYLPSRRFEVPQVRRVRGLFDVPETGSQIQAASEEAKALRSYTFSWVFFDEMAFADQASEVVTAALPTIQKDRFTGVSSANGEDVFWSMISDNGSISVPPGR